MTLRHIAVVEAPPYVFEVLTLFNRFGEETDLLSEAVTCVVDTPDSAEAMAISDIRYGVHTVN